MADPKLEARVTVPSGGWAISVDDGGGAVTVTIPAATYYLSSVGSGTRSLIAEIEYQLENTAGVGGAWTVSLSATTGKVTIAFDGTYTLVWTSTTLRDVLGFDGTEDTSSVATATGVEQAEPLWQPTAGYLDDFAPEDVSATSIAPTGRATKVTFAHRTPVALEWSGVQGRWVKTALETAVNEAWESFWRTYATGVDPVFRLYPDRSVAGTYTTYVLTDNRILAAPLTRGWTASAISLWTVTMHLETQP